MGARQVVGWPGGEDLGNPSREVPGGPRTSKRRAQDVRHEALRVPERGDLRSGWGLGHPKPGQIRGHPPARSNSYPVAAGLSGRNEESGPESPEKRRRTDPRSAEVLAGVLHPYKVSHSSIDTVLYIGIIHVP